MIERSGKGEGLTVLTLNSSGSRRVRVTVDTFLKADRVIIYKGDTKVHETDFLSQKEKAIFDLKTTAADRTSMVMGGSVKSKYKSAYSSAIKNIVSDVKTTRGSYKQGDTTLDSFWDQIFEREEIIKNSKDPREVQDAKDEMNYIYGKMKDHQNKATAAVPRVGLPYFDIPLDPSSKSEVRIYVYGGEKGTSWKVHAECIK